MSRYCSEDEQIVMTPTIRSQGHIIITMERLKPKEMEHQNITHIGGGDHTGIIITQGTTFGSESTPPELFLGLKVMLRSMSNNRKQQENWVLKFWFKEEVPEAERIENAQVFCTELVAFDGFPKDYVDFIKRTLKLMQLKYPSVQKVEVEMKKLEEKKKKRNNQEENYKSDTLRSRRRAEDMRDSKRVEESRIVQDSNIYEMHDTTTSRLKSEDLREMQRIEELRERERQKAEERERQWAEEREREKQKAEERERERLRAEEREKLAEERRKAEEREIERHWAEEKEKERRRIEEKEIERQRAEERERERQKAEERERQRAEERERERLRAEEREREKQRAEERERERQRAEEREREKEKQRAEERERQRAEERERQRAEERERQRAEERERQRAEEREKQRAEEAEKLRIEEIERERQRAEVLRERQRLEELRERQKIEEMRDLQKAEELRQLQRSEKLTSDDWRETYKTDSMKSRNRAEDHREKQQIDIAEANKTDTMKARKRNEDTTSFQYTVTEELKETDTMKARKKGVRSTPQTSETTKKTAYAELSSFEKDILEVVESIYPNALSFSAIAKSLDLPEDEELYQKLIELQNKGYLKCLKSGNFMRISANDPDVKMVRQLPMVPPGKQPTIAIITALFSEKLAVDTMIDDKETFVKFKTEGESQVYTLGVIGAHKVVSTKLPAMGHDRGQMIAAGSVTTRLLGSFSRVEYVFLIGVGGGVAHYTDYTKHVRLGDVVVSTPPDAQRSYVYMYCEPQSSVLEPTDYEQISIKTWGPPCMQLQQITLNLWQHGLRNPGDRLWERFLTKGLEQLRYRESSFCRPSSDSDKLYMSLGENLIEVGHPQPAEGSFDPRNPGMPVLHFGAVGSGRVLMPDDTTRLEFADRHGILAFDTEFDSVIESIFGNRKDNYVFIRGIADYKDGTKKKEWQPYAALAAASVMKAIICHLEPM